MVQPLLDGECLKDYMQNMLQHQLQDELVDFLELTARRKQFLTNNTLCATQQNDETVIIIEQALTSDEALLELNLVSPLTVADECCSFDVVSLFTNVPVPLAVSAARRALETDNDLSSRTKLSIDELFRLLDFCLNGTYFAFGGEYYKQTTGTAMGAPVSVIAANLVMECIEERALQSSPNHPKVFLRNVDDCFCILKKSDVDAFLTHVNSVEPSTQFTVERETDNRLPFLDVLVTRHENNLEFTVYRKLTHTGRHLPSDFNHPSCHKAAVVSFLLSWARNICSTEGGRKKEERVVMAGLLRNGYKQNFIQRISRCKPDDRPRAADTTVHRVKRISIPYVRGISEALVRVLAKEGIRVAHKPVSTLGHLIPRQTDCRPKEKAQGLIYKIPCSQCLASYIGETKNFTQRLQQHKKRRSQV
ncbi:uncharacterized protein LOC135384612 [Ornithodoros turicata]|uniref:uncharacterized protein LOC135384612 n=1 Tax=Ornithodoros turicata TaxID=34597 RepID=UPI00313943A4